MTKSHGDSQKISPQFMARLSALAADERVQALVMVQTASSQAPGSGATKRQSSTARTNAIQQMQQHNAQALTDIDAILAAQGGDRLSPAFNLLGTLSVRATRAAILALAKLPTVRAVIEDQAIGSVKR